MSDVEVLADLRRIVESPDNHCFVCSGTNPLGLQLKFELMEDVVVADFFPGKWHEGWQAVIHGGVLAAVLDEAMAYALFFRRYFAVTVRMEVRYQQRVNPGDQVRVEARVSRMSSRLVDVEARALRDGIVLVEATGRYLRLGRIAAEGEPAASRTRVGPPI